MNIPADYDRLSAVAQPVLARTGWRLALPLMFLLIGLATWVYWDAVASMVAIWWRSQTYAHGMIIIPISLYLAWRRWPQLRLVPPRPSWMGLAAVLAVSALWLLADVARVQGVAQLAFMLMLSALVWGVLGTSVLRLLAFPLGYLLFAVPFGESLIAPLMDFTAWFTVQGLELTGIPVYWEGRYIYIPSGNFEVAEGCSGQRYLIASVALGVLYAHLSYVSLWRKLVFIALAIVVPIVANGLRAYGIVMLAHLSDMRLAVGVDHLIYGWLFFGLVMLALFWLGSLWREDKPDEDAKGLTLDRSDDLKGLVVVAALAVPALLSGPLLAGWLDSRHPLVGTALVSPPGRGAWVGVEPQDANWAPQFVGATAMLRRDYMAGDRRVRLFVAVYGRQQQNAELINSQNTVYQRDYWRRLEEANREIPLADQRLTVNEVQLASREDQGLIWYWYDIGGHPTTNPIQAKLFEVWTRLTTAEPSAVIALLSDYEFQPEEARTVLSTFLAEMYTEISSPSRLQR